MRFFTADLHLGHRSMVTKGWRPWLSIESHNQALIDRWNETVHEGDIVYILGDVCMGELARSLVEVDKLCGRKILIPGNHDRIYLWQKTPKPNAVAKWMPIYRSHFYGVVANGHAMTVIDGQVVRMCHLPYKGANREGDTREWPDEAHPLNTGGWLLHGHVHNGWKVRDRMINVGVDQWDFRPVSENQVRELINGDHNRRAGRGGKVDTGDRAAGVPAA